MNIHYYQYRTIQIIHEGCPKCAAQDGPLPLSMSRQRSANRDEAETFNFSLSFVSCCQAADLCELLKCSKPCRTLAKSPARPRVQLLSKSWCTLCVCRTFNRSEMIDFYFGKEKQLATWIHPQARFSVRRSFSPSKQVSKSQGQQFDECVRVSEDRLRRNRAGSCSAMNLSES